MNDGRAWIAAALAVLGLVVLFVLGQAPRTSYGRVREASGVHEAPVAVPTEASELSRER
jgi:hypothetical protein